MRALYDSTPTEPSQRTGTQKDVCLAANLGIIGYGEACRLQENISALRTVGYIPDSMLLLQHNHVFTLGKHAEQTDVLANETVLKNIDTEIHRVDRGGQVTYHGPGQMVVYPILDVRAQGGAAKYIETLKSIIIRTLRDFGIAGYSKDNLTGVWVGKAKIAAIGVRIKQGITTHGFALNVNTDLSYFQHIVACGDPEIECTSMMEITRKNIPLSLVANKLKYHASILFERTMVDSTIEDVLSYSQPINYDHGHHDDGASDLAL